MVTLAMMIFFLIVLLLSYSVDCREKKKPDFEIDNLESGELWGWPDWEKTEGKGKE